MIHIDFKDIAWGAIVFGLCFLLLRSCEKGEYYRDLNDAAYGRMEKYRNKLGQEVAKSQSLYTDLKTLKSLKNSQDSDIQRLLKLVKKNTHSATVISNQTSVSGTTSTEIVHDTIEVEGDSIYPVYKTKWKDRWSEGFIIANKDSVRRVFTVFNEFDIVQKWEKPQGIKNIFKPKTLIVEVTNLNPNTETIELKNFTIKPPKQRRWIVFTAGVLLGGGAAFKLLK